MRVILFIGHHKVGSTSLQDFLSRNSVALARAGILYPSVDFEGMALMLGTALSAQRWVGDLPINAREPHNALAFRMLSEHKKGGIPPYHKGLPASSQMFRAIRKQIEFLAPDTVILAAEVFANFAAADPELIARLGQVFEGAEITVIATLRRIDDYLASWHGQRLKFGHDLAPLCGDGMQGYFGTIHFDYRLMLKGWIDAMPDARFVLRDYSAVRAAGGSIPDFVAQAGLALPPDLVPEQRTNESLHRGVYEIVRRANTALGGPQAKRLRRFLRQITPELDLPPSRDIELFGARNRQILARRFEPVQGFLADVSGVSPFFADQQEITSCRPVPEADAFRQALDGLARCRIEFAEPEIQDFLKALDAEGRAGT
jgi:hypothetical protein